MITPEHQPTTAMPGSRWFQFSVRTMFGLTGGATMFFSLAGAISYVDAVAALAGIVVLVGVMEYPRRVHLSTGILLTFVAGALLWANLRPTGWQSELNVSPPDQLDRVAQSMFYRGWPLCPCMTCLIHGMKFHPNELGVYGILVLDGVVLTAILFVVRGACEWSFRRRGRPFAMTPPDRSPHGTSGSAVS